MTTAYDKQIGGNHYKDMAIQPSEFINKNSQKISLFSKIFGNR